MNKVVFAHIMDNETSKLAVDFPWGAALRAPFQALGSKITKGKYDLPEDVVREKTGRRYESIPTSIPFAKGIARGLDKRYLTGARQTLSNENLGIGLGATGAAAGVYAGGKLLSRAVKNKMRAAQTYKDQAGAVESFGARLRGENISRKNARGNLAAGYGTIGGLGAGGYLIGRVGGGE